MNTYPMSAEQAELARDRDYKEYVPTQEERDERYDAIAKSSWIAAKHLLETEDTEKIADMFRMLMEADVIRCGPGIMHDDYRRKLVGKMMDLHRAICKDYAEAA